MKYREMRCPKHGSLGWRQVYFCPACAQEADDLLSWARQGGASKHIPYPPPRPAAPPASRPDGAES